MRFHLDNHNAKRKTKEIIDSLKWHSAARNNRVREEHILMHGSIFFAMPIVVSYLSQSGEIGRELAKIINIRDDYPDLSALSPFQLSCGIVILIL